MILSPRSRRPKAATHFRIGTMPLMLLGIRWTCFRSCTVWEGDGRIMLYLNISLLGHSQSAGVYFCRGNSTQRLKSKTSAISFGVYARLVSDYPFTMGPAHERSIFRCGMYTCLHRYLVLCPRGMLMIRYRNDG